MSWSAWPQAGPPMPGVAATPAIQTAILPSAVNSAPNVLPPATGAAIPAGMQYSPEQWAQMQQQNWQQWAQWQQQYQQWHQQYGAEYQKSMSALAVTAPPAATNTGVPPPPPNDNKPPPPPPPDDGAQHGQYNTMPPPKLGGGYTTAPPNQQYNTGPPPNFRQQPQNQWQNSSNKRPLSQGEDYDGGKRQMLDNQGQWNKPAQPPKATSQSWQSQPPPSTQTHAQKVLNLEELTVAEKKFDKEFAAWEAQFNKWKDQNANHPDKTQYMEYEKKWESWRNSLLDRREQMRKKRHVLQASMATSAPPSKPAPDIIPPQQSFHQPPPVQQPSYPNQKNQPPSVDIFSKPPPTQNNEPLAFKPSKGFPGEVPEQEGGADFLKSSTSEGIPGLDLVKEGQNEDLPEDKADEPVVEDTAAPTAAKGPDLDAISKGINSILGDSKLMNMLSMVSQNQSFAGGNIPNIQPKMLEQPPPVHQPANLSQPPPKSNAPIPSLLSMPLQRPPVDQPSQKYDDYRDQYSSSQREDVTNFDDQTRMSFSNGPNDQDISYGNNFSSGPPPGVGRLSRNESFNRGDTRNNFGGNFNDDGRDKFDSFDGPPPGNRPVFNKGGNNDNQGSFNKGNQGGFNNRGFNKNDSDNFDGPPGNRPGFNQGGNNDNQGSFNSGNQGGFNNRGFNKNDSDNFDGPLGNRPGFNQGGKNDNQSSFNNDNRGGFNNRGFNRNDSFNNRNDKFNSGRDNFNNRGGKFDRNNDYDNYGDDYDDRFNENFDDYSQEYDNQGFNNRRGFQNQEGYGDDYNEEGWNEDEEYEKYHHMFNEGEQPPETPSIAVAVPRMPPPVPQPEEVVPPVDEGPLFVPEVVVDYEHKSLKEPEPEVRLEPIHMFDYRHKPVNRIPYPQRPMWLQGALRNTRQFDPLGGGRFSGTDRQYDPLGISKLPRDISKDRPNDDKYRDYRDRPGDDKFRDYRDRPKDDKFRDYRDRPNDDKFRDYRDKPNDDKFRDYRQRPNDEKVRDYRYGDKRQELDRNRNDNNPRNREKDVRGKDRVYEDRLKNQKSFSDKKLDLEDLSDDEWKDEDAKKPNSKEGLLFSPPHQKIDMRSSPLSMGVNSSNTSINAPINQNLALEDLINAPGRYNRPQRIVIILRGPPGSGKTYLARLIKDREVENGGSAPRILSLDDYFMIEQEREVFEDGKPCRVKEMVYEYEAEMEESYRQSLTKAFKKTVTDGYFSFIVVDNVNQKVKYFGEMWSYAKQNGFQVYICQMDLDPQLCTKRNIHNRSQSDIEDCIAGWEPTPAHHPLVDATNFLQSCGPITEVEMEEVDQSQDETEDGAEPGSMASTNRSVPPGPWKSTSNWATSGKNPRNPQSPDRRGFDGPTWKNRNNRRR